MKLMASLTRASKFTIQLNETNFIEEIFYRPLTKFLFKNYRDEKWKNYMIEYKSEDDLTTNLSRIFYNFCKKNDFKEKFLSFLKIENNDYVLRFLLHCLIERNMKSVLIVIISLTYLLRDKKYTLPSYSDKFYE